MRTGQGQRVNQHVTARMSERDIKCRPGIPIASQIIGGIEISLGFADNEKISQARPETSGDAFQIVKSPRLYRYRICDRCSLVGDLAARIALVSLLVLYHKYRSPLFIQEDS